MSDSTRKRYMTAADWDEVYRQGTPPWDVGLPHAELAGVFDEYNLRPQTALEIGCGSGADAVFLAGKRLEITAVDCSPIAVERARVRAERKNALIRFVLADVFEFALSSGTFDFVYEAGVYHALRQYCLERYLDMLWRVTRPGSYYLCLAGAPNETAETGPPQVSESEIQNELGRLFELVHLRPTRLPSVDHKEGHPAWSCLMRRPLVEGKS